MTANSSNGPDLVSVAGVDKRAARMLVGVDQKRAVAQERRRDEDAAARRVLNVEAERTRIAREERAAQARERTDAAAGKLARRQARRENRRAVWSSRRAWLDARVAYARSNGAAVWSMVVYALAVGTAVAGQASVVTTELKWPLIAGVGVAVFVEGLALSMALTAHELRLRGEKAYLPRALTWIAAAGAAGINFTAHKDNQIAAVLLAGSSVAGILVWEIRSGAKHRDRLRELGLIPEPSPRLGAAFWLRYPGRAWRAYSACIADPSIRTREAALDAGGARPAVAVSAPAPTKPAVRSPRPAKLSVTSERVSAPAAREHTPAVSAPTAERPTLSVVAETGSPDERMRACWDREVAAGRVPTGADLATAGGASPATGRRRRAEWEQHLPADLVGGAGDDAVSV